MAGLRPGAFRPSTSCRAQSLREDLDAATSEGLMAERVAPQVGGAAGTAAPHFEPLCPQKDLLSSPRLPSWNARRLDNRRAHLCGRELQRSSGMKIAQIAPLFESVPPRLYGGTERVVSYLTEELVKQGHRVTCSRAPTQSLPPSSLPARLALCALMIRSAMPFRISC